MPIVEMLVMALPALMVLPIYGVARVHTMTDTP